ncbi:MAG: DUF3887 domain-containing protein [Lachnospiraceae bacterium]|nr:DUF3887 domain-containing protein [Lachnospiraceae bacterium]
MKLKKLIATTLTFLLLFILAGCSTEEPGISTINWDNHNERAGQFVMALENGDYTIAAENFSADMNRALGIRGLKKAWEDINKPAGEFITITGTEIEEHEEYDIYIVTSQHENKDIKSRIVFSEDGLIAGLFISIAD